uniref:mitogen-activated protein kinase kinase kinase 17 n=1 Tax=Erigeron canadensis TaxID=72917 RepID=UPI001CB9587E|nr:mitogen-activated protein kinase kinase kinase 17 [Erigeron canadensis]
MTNKPNWARGICIGKGSFGSVNLAVDKTNNEIFAVKSVNYQTTTYDDRFCQALENEIRILKSLSSPFVVKYHGDDTSLENSKMVYRNLHMEYMPGGTVADLDRHQLNDVMVRGYTRCIVSALSYIHSRNIVHCDVKGKNVLVGSVPGSAKLADFGSAVEMGGNLVSGTRGSPLWMAPEVVRGEYQGPESDVWSLGCTVIEMITGKPAWQDRGVDTLCQIGYSEELPNLPTQMSHELKDFVSKCLRRNRFERWSCDQLLQHPFLLTCSSSSLSFESNWSPRCVFDWSSINLSDASSDEEGEASEVENSNVNSNSSNTRQRIGTLCSNSSPNWESDGWELVRDVTVTNSEPLEYDSIVTESEMVETWPEYPDSVENNDEDATFSGNERTNQEYGDSNENLHNDDKFTNHHAQSTSSGWHSRDTDNNYSCVYVSLNIKLLLFNSIGIRHIYYKILFLFSCKPIADLVPVVQYEYIIFILISHQHFILLSRLEN